MPLLRGRIQRGFESTFRLFDRIGVGAGLISGGLSIIIVSIVNYAVFTRYVLNRPQFWIEEITAYFYVGFVFLSLAYATLEEAHVSCDIIISRAPPRVRCAVSIVGYLLIFIISVVMVYKGGSMAVLYFTFDWRSSSSLGVLLWPIVAMLPLGFAIFTLTILSRLYTTSKQFQNVHSSKSHEYTATAANKA